MARGKSPSVTLYVAAVLAMSASFIAGTCAVVWWVAPWVSKRPWPHALTPLLLVHLFRHIALQLVSDQRGGFLISNAGRDQIVYGDLLGFALALGALAAIQRGWALWKPLMWVFAVATVLDLGNALVLGLREQLFDHASGVSWIILTFYVPALWLSTGVIVWQLVSRRDPHA
jgi:hypothetical protein